MLYKSLFSVYNEQSSKGTFSYVCTNMDLQNVILAFILIDICSRENYFFPCVCFLWKALRADDCAIEISSFVWFLVVLFLT